jgi:hypothetical protein
MLLGPLTWAVHLLIVYGAHASICEAGDRLPFFGPSSLPLLLWSATGAALAITASVAIFPGTVQQLLAAGGSDRGFSASVTRVLGALSAIAVLYAAIAINALPACAVAR